MQQPTAPSVVTFRSLSPCATNSHSGFLPSRRGSVVKGNSNSVFHEGGVSRRRHCWRLRSWLVSGTMGRGSGGSSVLGLWQLQRGTGAGGRGWGCVI